MTDTELFRTIHGSHLYGLAHAGSDLDVFVVTASTRLRARHGFLPDGTDVSTRGLKQFLIHATSGSHQSVEALFSPHKEWAAEGLAWRPMIESMRITGPEVFAKYERTIKNFAHGDLKRRRHAVRLALNLTSLRAHGRFHPVLSPAQAARATDLAERLQGAALLDVIQP